MRHSRRHLTVFLITLTALLCAILVGCGGEKNSATGPSVTLTSLPEEGAGISINDRGYGTTPTTIRNLPAGQYYAILTQYGYKRETKVFTVPEEGEIQVVAIMRPLIGYISIDSKPPGAKVYFDGDNLIGETPFRDVSIPIGFQTYEVRLDNHNVIKHSLTIQEDYRYTRAHSLTPMKGHLQVYSRPSDSQIYINDQLQKNRTPSRFDLAPGIYSVGAYQKGYLMAEKAIEILPNGDHSADLRLKKGNMPPGMVLIPAGEFIFGVDGGAPDERPRRKLHLDAFYIDKFEITHQEFAKIFPAHTYEENQEDFPVSGVTWNQASEYALAVGKRLPTEQEWEKAARGADGLEYPWGNKFDPRHANSFEGEESHIQKVGQFRGGASPYSVMDMAGNLYEWTSDWYQPYEGNKDVTVDYGQVFRVLRGGSFRSDPFNVRGAKRHYDKGANSRDDYGFRCVMDISTRTPPNQTQTPD